MIDANYNFSKTRWQDLYKVLSDNGFNVFSPGQKSGDCHESYVVIKENGTQQFNNFSTNRENYDIMCYVPFNEYSKLREFVDSVKECVKKLRPMITLSNDDTDSYYDESIKAHMISFTCFCYRKWR